MPTWNSTIVVTGSTVSTTVYPAVVQQTEPQQFPMCRGRQHGDALTTREWEILMELTTRSTLQEIAARLYISPNTLKTHLKSLYRKIGVGSRREAADLVEPSLARAS